MRANGDPSDEVKDVAECLGASPVGCEGGAEEEREIHAAQVELVTRSQRGCEDESAGEPAHDRSPDAHRSSSLLMASAALIGPGNLSP